MVKQGASIGVVLALLLISVVQMWAFAGFSIDDAYISFRYAQQWAAGNGLVYNIGERVEGYSNFLWIALLLPFAKIGVDLPFVAKMLGGLLSLATLGLTYHFGRRLLEGNVAAWLVACSAPFAAWAVGQLETPLFTFLLLSASFSFLIEEEKGTGWWSGIVFGLLALTRPEGVIFFLGAAAVRTYHLWHESRRPTHQDLLRLLLWLSIVLPYLAWRLVYYGYPLPNTVYAKSLGLHPRALLEGMFYLYQSVGAAGGFFFLAVPFLLALIRPTQPMVVHYLAVSVIGQAAFVIVGGGDWMPMQRFLVHILPLLFLLIQVGLLRLHEILRPVPWGKYVASLALVGQLVYLLAGSVEARFAQGIGTRPTLPHEPSVPAYLANHLRPGDVVAVTDAGLIAYSLPLETRVVDMVGLTDKHIAHLPVNLAHGLLGQGDAFGKWDVDYVLAQQPRFVQIQILGTTPEGEYITNFTGTALLANDNRFRQDYELVQETGITGLFVRKEAK